jgi:hypothetical protein
MHHAYTLLLLRHAGGRVAGQGALRTVCVGRPTGCIAAELHGSGPCRCQCILHPLRCREARRRSQTMHVTMLFMCAKQDGFTVQTLESRHGSNAAYHCPRR